MHQAQEIDPSEALSEGDKPSTWEQMNVWDTFRSIGAMKVIKKGDTKYNKGEKNNLREKLLLWGAGEIRGKW